ncbi:MAG: hypothetical protein KC731_34385, partial [Myxococcales bacterium]|nr:hypothetical protein [Myxococcales bacterium]
ESSYGALMDSAFVATNLYAGTAVELYHQPGVSSTYETASGVTQAKEYDRDLVFLRLLYGFDYALGEQVAIGLDADYLAEVGANGDSLLLRGGQTGFLFRPNLTVRVYRDADSGTQLALIGHGSFGAGIRAVPQGMLAALSDAIDSIADDPSGARSQCLAAGDLDCALGDGASVGDATKLTRRRYGGGGTAVWAQAMGRVLGFQVALGAEGARENISTALAGDVGATQVAAHAGFAPALNFAPSFPLGLTLEYRVELNHSRYSGNATVGIRDGAQTLGVNHRLGGGAYYTGRRDLLLGWTAGVAFLQDVDSSVIEAAASRATTLGGEPMEQPRAIVGSAQFEMRYFF